MKEASSNLAKGKIRSTAQAGISFRATCSSSRTRPRIEEIVLRVLEIDTGTLTDGAITLTVVQDVFSLPLDVPEISEQGNEWTTPSTAPAEATTATLMELPYWALLDALGVAETGTLGDGAGISPRSPPSRHRSRLTLTSGRASARRAMRRCAPSRSARRPLCWRRRSTARPIPIYNSTT